MKSALSPTAVEMHLGIAEKSGWIARRSAGFATSPMHSGGTEYELRIPESLNLKAEDLET